MKLTPPQQFIARILTWTYGLVILFLPLHAVLTTWAGSNFGHIDVFRIWKELIVAITTPLVVYLMVSRPELRTWVRRDWILRLIAAYVLLHIILGGLALHAGRVNAMALFYALFANLRYLWFFVEVYVVAQLVSPVYKRWIIGAVMAGVGIVIVFGLLQVTVLPMNFLAHFGYGLQTIPAFQTVDNKPDYQRIQSTLRGANPLGAYMVLVFSLLIVMLYKYKGDVRRILGLSLPALRLMLAVSILAGLVVLFYTYSRSAYLGVIAVSGVVLLVYVPYKFRLILLAIGAVGVIVIAAGIYMLRDNNFVQNTVFHSDETSQATESSNSKRAGALESGLADVTHEPFGRGPGTAGPASFRNNKTPRIAENYYLQIGQETGWMGLGLLLTISIAVCIRLWRVRSDWLAVALLASFCGLFIVNLLSHAWTDDTLGMLWWGLAGLCLGSVARSQLEGNQNHGKVPRVSR